MKLNMINFVCKIFNFKIKYKIIKNYKCKKKINYFLLFVLFLLYSHYCLNEYFYEPELNV